jgi:hypothetical protein
MRSPFLLVSRMTRWPSGSAVDASGSGDEAVRLMHALGRKWVLVRVSLNEQQVIKIYTTWDRAEDAALRSGVKLYIRWGAARRRLWTGNYSRWRVLLQAKPTRAQRRMELMEQPRRATVTRHQWVSAQIATLLVSGVTSHRVVSSWERPAQIDRITPIEAGWLWARIPTSPSWPRKMDRTVLGLSVVANAGLDLLYSPTPRAPRL